MIAPKQREKTSWLAPTKMDAGVSYTVFQIINYLVVITMAIVCIAPLIHVLAVSFSSSVAAQAGRVKFFPVDFNMQAYEYIIDNSAFWRAMVVSLKRIAIGGTLSMFLTVLTAYPMSKSAQIFPQRKYYVWFLFVTMIFNGGMIPTFLVVRYTGLLDTIWALVLPSAVSVWNIILMLNFFRQLPKELDEAAFIDGAGHFTVLWKIYLPVSAPAIATVTLFTVVAAWNAWFDGMLYMNRPEHYPLQTYLRTVIVTDTSTLLSSAEALEMYKHLSQETLKAAQIFVGALPIIMVYPFLQRHFTQGIVLGSVKG